MCESVYCLLIGSGKEYYSLLGFLWSPFLPCLFYMLFLFCLVITMTYYFVCLSCLQVCVVEAIKQANGVA